MSQAGPILSLVASLWQWPIYTSTFSTRWRVTVQWLQETLVWNAGNSPGRNITSSNGNISVQCLESIHRKFDIMDSASPTPLGLFFSLAAIVKGCLPLPVAQCRRFPACQRWCSQCLLRTFFDSVKSILLCYISICHRTSLGQLH